MSKFSAADTLELPVAERLKLVADIWDTIAAAPEALPLTDEDKRLIDERLEACRRNPQAGSPWEEDRLSIRPEAEADMTEAFEWYEERQSALGYEFLAEVHVALRAIAENPLHHQVLYKNVRRILPRKFPALA